MGEAWRLRGEKEGGGWALGLLLRPRDGTPRIRGREMAFVADITPGARLHHRFFSP